MTACETCGHPVCVHSREPGVGCLQPLTFTARAMRIQGVNQDVTHLCPCTVPGTSAADQ